MITLLTSHWQYEWGFEEEYGMKQACSYPPWTGTRIQDLCELTDCLATYHFRKYGLKRIRIGSPRLKQSPV